MNDSHAGMDSHVRYKWTYANRTAIYGITDYPRAGRWSERRTPLLCESGWHVSTNNMLSRFISTELWEVRVKGAHVEDKHKEAWENIRFVRRVETWDDEGILAFIKFCRPQNWQEYAHAAAHADAYAARAASASALAVHASASAHAAAYDAASAAHASADAAVAAYKSQSEWLMQNIILKGR